MMNIRLVFRLLILGMLLLAAACSPSATPTPTNLPPTSTYTPSPHASTATPLAPTDVPTAALEPPARADAAIAYDSHAERIILFGGLGTFDCARNTASLSPETWALDVKGKKWELRQPAANPEPITGGQMAFDVESKGSVLFGGYNNKMHSLDAAWAYDYDADAWTPLSSGPAARAFHRMIYDSESDRIIVFGGASIQRCMWTVDMPLFSDTWAYDLNTDTWTQMNPPTAPPARADFNMAYDSVLDRVVIWGGYQPRGTEYDHHLWAYDFNTDSWEVLQEFEHMWDYDYNTGAWISAPGAKGADSSFEGVMVFDAQSRLIVLYGGVKSDQTWLYNLSKDSWKKVNTPTLSPGIRFAFGMVYHPGLDRLVFHGGATSGAILPQNDTWLYDTDTNTWEKLLTGP